MNKAIFLDRDGTIIKDFVYNNDIDKIQIMPGAIEFIKKFQKEFKIIVITNQSAVAREICSIKKVKNFNKKLIKIFNSYGVKIDKIYFCPHCICGKTNKYNVDCECRKPKIGLIKKSQKKYNINLQKSYMIGDKLTDVQCRNNANCLKSYLLSDTFTFDDIAKDIIISKF